MGNHSGRLAPTPDAPYGLDTTVTVDDRTNGEFPVEQAVASWRLSNVRMGNCTENTAGCVVVLAVRHLKTQHPHTIHSGNTLRHAPGTATIRLSEETPPHAMLQVTAHELGHAWGLDHEPGTTMEPISNGRHPTPSPALRAEAARDLR
jgi:hypothetical protein